MNQVTNKRIPVRTLLLALLISALSILTACGSDDILLAPRPSATSTPAPGSGVRPALAPVTEASVAEGASANLAATTPLTGEELSVLSTEAQLALAVVPQRDLRDLALRLIPERDEIPIVVNEATPQYAIGNTAPFWVHDIAANTNFQITAELIHKSDVAYAWVEAGKPFDRAAIAASIDRFSEISYPAESALFGNEWKPGVDNDPRLHVLHATGIGAGVAGYYSSADQYSRLANEFSNEKEMFYINLDWLNRVRDYTYYETVLAHEFQHMVHWYRDRNEETWLNEGLSEYAQEVAGYPPDTNFASTFALEPDTQLNTWRASNQSNAEHYGSAYLFVSYLAQRFGPEFMADLVSHPANGLTGLEATLAESGLALTADEVFADWVVANYVDDPNALALDGIYGYHHLEQAPPRLEAEVDRFPATVETTVNNYGTDYYAITGDGTVTIDFAGATTTGLAGTAPYSGSHAWWSNRTDDSNTRLTRAFDFSEVAADTPIELAATSWWDIESDYDYGYVVASRDGRKWDILPGQRTTTANPSGNSFGHAYTGVSLAEPAATPSVESTPQAATWVTERYDLSEYAGDDIFLRFEYVTDDAVNRAGWFVDDLAIPAIGYATDFENGPDGWESEGWLLIDNKLNQDWLLQVMEFEDAILTAVRRVPVDGEGRATIALDGLGDGKTAALAISALAPVTTEPATYELEIVDR